MRIYLDSCVIQSLKETNQEDLLASILEDKVENIYCYSEAHLLDLMRDKSDNKFADLEFMEKIVDKNCWFYNKGIDFRHIRPVDYYDPFPEYQENLFDPEDIFSEDVFPISFKSLFSSIPLDLQESFSNSPLPPDFPKQLEYLIKKPTNLYEMICALGNMTNDLSNEQKDFKEVVSYLHRNALNESFFEAIGIKGYDGEKITNKEEFRDSYTKHFLKENQERYRYELFLDQYNGLEFFSIVRGKPKKQKMMNMINDGRHAFFGGFCDIVVSKDNDFLEKTKFLYDIHNIETMVLNMEEYKLLLENNKKERSLMVMT